MPLIKRRVDYTPVRRAGTESEVSAAIVFLLSPDAAFISGSCLRVDYSSRLDVANTSEGSPHKSKRLFCLPMKTKGVGIAKKFARSA